MRRLAWLGLLLTLACAREEVVIVCFGDSTTLWRGPEINWTRLVEEQLSSPERPVRVISSGRSSDDTDLARRRFWWDVVRHRPDLVTLLFGINDAVVEPTPDRSEPRGPLERYVENLRYFADRVRDLGGQPILVTPNPLRWKPLLRERHPGPPYRHDDPRGLNAVLEGYVEAVRQLAENEQLALVDLYRTFEDSDRRGGPPVRDLLMDGIHPNDAGHRLMAREIGAELARALPRLRSGAAAR